MAYRLNRFRHIFQGKRTIASIFRIPTIRRIESISNKFTESEIKFYGSYLWLVLPAKIVFGSKTFSNVLEEIYNNQKKKEKQVSTLINELKEMIEDIGDATLLVPLIKEYLEIGVKNDDLLIKMAALAQRALAAESVGESLTISEEEKQQLLAEIEKFNK